jgi:hypothetical protein
MDIGGGSRREICEKNRLQVSRLKANVPSDLVPKKATAFSIGN